MYFPSIQQSAHDFLIFEDGTFKSVQVKTASRIKSGNYGYIQCRTRLTNKYKSLTPTDIADVWAIIYRESIWVIPASEIDTSNLCLGCDKGLTTKRHWRWEAYRVR